MIPKYHELMHPVLLLLSKGAYSRKEASDELIDNFSLSDQEKEEKMKSGANRFYDRISWAFTYLVKAKYIKRTNEKKVYTISELGLKELLSATAKNIKIDQKYLVEHVIDYYQNWKVSKAPLLDNDDYDDDNSNQIDDGNFDLEKELDESEENFDLSLLELIKNLTWQDFEDFCAILLEKMGYGVASKRTIRVGDDGLDGEIFEDELGLRGKIYIQAKKWDKNNISPKDMKEFLYNIRGNKGVFITTSDFSDRARAEALNYKEGKLALINNVDLVKLCKKYEVLCRKKTLYIYEITSR